MEITTISIAGEIFDELGEPSSINTGYVNTWLVNNIGKLNNLIGSGYIYDSGVTGFGSGFTNDEKDIYKESFFINFYKRGVNSNLGAGSYDVSNDWTEIREFDSSIKRVNRNELAKSFASFHAAAQVNLNNLVFAYQKARSLPDQTIGDDVIAECYPYPRWSYRSRTCCNDLI